MSLKNDDATVLADPQWIPTHLSPDRKQVQFAWVPRDSHHKISFLADQYLRDLAPPSLWLGRDKLDSPAVSGPAHYIFHSAFCCSTLIASALDLKGVAMGLKEPQILNELAAVFRARALPGALLSSVTGLLARGVGAVLADLLGLAVDLHGHELIDVLAGTGTEHMRLPRMPLIGEERAHVERIVRQALATRPEKYRSVA